MQMIDVTDVDFDAQAVRKVEEFPFYHERLRMINYQKYIDEGEDWKDPFFPPVPSSIVDPEMQTDARAKWADFTWRRPKEVWTDGDFCLYNQIDANDIQQGLLGDCYFLSCLSAIAEDPERIKRIFITQETNEAGIYAVQLYINGEPRVVVVDDYFPYNEAKGKWAFSRPSESNEIWVLILEKAWAKVYGSYSRIEVGDCGEAMAPLTGCPTQNVSLKDYKNKDNLWKLLHWADRSGFPMCCAANSAEE